MIVNQTQPHQWKLVSPGLCGQPGTVSIQSVANPNNYLRHQNFLIYEDPFTSTTLYKNDACFYQRSQRFFPGFDAFESVNYPGRFIRHQNNRLKLHPYENTAIFEKDASFRAIIPTCNSFQSRNFPSHHWGLRGDAAYIESGSQNRWIIVSPGLTGDPNTVSFRACHDATKYLRHADYVLWEHPVDYSIPYRKDATFIQHKNIWYFGYDAYESFNYPLHFIRHQNSRLKISSYDGSVLYENDASFRLD